MDHVFVVSACSISISIVTFVCVFAGATFPSLKQICSTLRFKMKFMQEVRGSSNISKKQPQILFRQFFLLVLALCVCVCLCLFVFVYVLMGKLFSHISYGFPFVTAKAVSFEGSNAVRTKTN